MAVPVLFDFTHLLHRLGGDGSSGIDQVDLEYARYFVLGARAAGAGVHYSYLPKPHFVSPDYLAQLVRKAEHRWRAEHSGDAVLDATLRWLNGDPQPTNPAQKPLSVPLRSAFAGLVPKIRKGNPWMFSPLQGEPTRGAVYLNVAQHALEHPWHFRWLQQRSDVRPVFFVHDLLPLDHPEFWQAGHLARFEKRIDVMLRYARGLIVASETVRERLREEIARRRRPEIPIHAAPLPSPLGGDRDRSPDASLSQRPYFVVLGTIEPRKNHLLLLNVWRDIARTSAVVPKLVIVGRRGWENEQVVDLLDRCRELKGHVCEAPGVSRRGLRKLIANARALLMPSFGEGYGLPMAEALRLGAPVLASDPPVSRETTRGRAVYRHVLDGLGWRDAVLQLADPKSELARAASRQAAAYVAPEPSNYFAGVEAFLEQGLGR